MDTKITGIESAQIASIGAGRAVQRPQDAASGSAHSSSSESGSGESQDVQITGTARQLANLDQIMRDIPAVNETRVAQIRASIEQGTYTVRPDHIADQLLSMEHALSRLPDTGESDSPADAPNPEQ